MPAPLKIAIACPMELVRAGVRAMLANTGIQVIGEVGNASQLRTFIKQKKPQVLIIDSTLPGCVRQDSFELVSEMKDRLGDVSLIFVTTVENPTYTARARAAGAWNCLPMSVGREELVTAVRNAALKKPVTGTGAFAAITGSLSTRATATSDKNLTPREQQVLSHLAYGLSNDEIASSLDISVETVKEHVQKILRKLAVKDRTQAAVWAVRQKLA
jgi:DNA-binding NarL/FixJ family response regulator